MAAECSYYIFHKIRASPSKLSILSQSTLVFRVEFMADAHAVNRESGSYSSHPESWSFVAASALTSGTGLAGGTIVALIIVGEILVGF